MFRVDTRTSLREQHPVSAVVSTVLPVENLFGETILLSGVTLQVMLYKLGDGGTLLIYIQWGQHGTDGMFADGLTQSFNRTPFDVAQIGVAFMRGVEVAIIIIQHVYVGCGGCDPWTYYKVLLGVTAHL